jgi:hypothetical protein
LKFGAPDARSLRPEVPARRGRMTAKFRMGDKVRKRNGYEYPGFIVSVFTNRAGAVRYVVEADHPAFSGMLHIFNEEQLELRESRGQESPDAARR